MGILSERPIEKFTEGFAGRVEPSDGDAILWLHGYTLDSSSWGKMWELLPGWHHIGIDLPGHGASSPIAEGSNLLELGSRLGKICEERNVRHIVALSFGTTTAIQLAIQFPDSFSSIVLGAPSIAGGPQDSDMAVVFHKLFSLYNQTGPTQELQDFWLDSRPWKSIEKYPLLYDAISSLVTRHSWEELSSYTKMSQFFHPPQNEKDLNKIKMPMLILVGEYEMPVFQECADILKCQVPNSTLHELPDTDHLCMLQTPELSARLIDEHLRKHADSSPKNPPGQSGR